MVEHTSLPLTVLFREILRCFFSIYDNQGVSMSRSLRSACVERIFDLLPNPAPEIDEILADHYNNRDVYECLDELLVMAESLPKRARKQWQTPALNIAIEAVSNDWLIAEFLWYWLDWYRGDAETHDPIDQLTAQEQWAKIATSLHPIRVLEPHFSLEELRLEVNDRWHLKNAVQELSKKPIPLDQ